MSHIVSEFTIIALSSDITNTSVSGEKAKLVYTMGNSLEHRISVLVAAVGIAIFLSGLLLFVSSYLVEDILKDLKEFNDFGQNHCEYWAALPVSRKYTNISALYRSL